MASDSELREIHSREVPVASRLDEFHTGLGAVLNRVGSTSGTEMSEDGHHIAGAGRDSARLVQDGAV